MLWRLPGGRGRGRTVCPPARRRPAALAGPSFPRRCGDTAERCLYGEHCNADGLCEICPLSHAPRCDGGYMLNDAYGRSCDKARCECPAGQLYVNGGCSAPAACETDEDCTGEGETCDTTLCRDYPCTGDLFAGCRAPDDGPHGPGGPGPGPM